MVNHPFELRPLFVAVLFLLASCGFGTPDRPAAPAGPAGPFAVLLTLDGEIPQFSDPTALFGKPATSQHRLDKLVKQAAQDFKVKEVVVHIGSPAVSLARASEIVEILQQIPKAGKKLVCHLDTGDNIGYWIASSACPEILLSPAGEISVLGLSFEPVFIRELLASLGISAEMLHIGAYKDAGDTLTRDSMSDAAREAALSTLGELHGVLVAGIATGRKLESEAVQSLIDKGPYAAPAALKLGLVDGITPLQTYLEGIISTYPGGVEDKYGKPPAKELSLTDLLKIFRGRGEREQAPKNPRIALVPVIGPIVGGEEDALFGGAESVYERSLSATLGELGRDDTVKAVVLRIDSPGGSALASDNLWHAVRGLAEKKTVIASMGDVAASGGYYIASAAHEVFATPATLTGSIGVVGGKLVFGEAAQKIGVHTELLKTGEHAGLHSPFRPFGEAERELINRLMTDAYNLFIDRVAAGRNLDRQKVLEAADGRVWTGSQAISLGLVNHIGGIEAAIARARVLASQPAGVPVEVMPKPKSFMEIMGDALSEPEVRVTRRLAEHHPALRFGLSLASLLSSERVLAVAPFTVSIR